MNGDAQQSTGATEVLEIQKLFDESTAAQALADEKMQDAAGRLTALANMVLNGETSTGSNFQDYMLIAHVVLGASEIAKLSAIQDQLPKYQNQLMLIVTAEEKNSVRSTSPTAPKHLYIDETLYLGIISGEKMLVDLSKAQCNFPTGGRHAKSEMHEKAVLVDGDLGFNSWSDLQVIRWDRELKCENPSNKWRRVPLSNEIGSEPWSTRYMELEVVLGTEAVIKWVTDRGPVYQKVLEPLLRALGIGEQISLPLTLTETRA